MLSMEFQYRFPYNCQQWSVEKYPMLNILCVNTTQAQECPDGGCKVAELTAEGIVDDLAAPSPMHIAPWSRMLPSDWGMAVSLTLGCVVPEFQSYVRWFETASG